MHFHAHAFTTTEWRGLRLFAGHNDNDGELEKGEGAQCAECHSMAWHKANEDAARPDWAPAGMVPPLFTDFSFHNIGTPRNTAYPLTRGPIDHGIGAVLNDSRENGKFKTMTLRNIELTAPYTHHGFFTRLDQLVHFYNTRDREGALHEGRPWPVAEVPETVNREELGNLGLSDADERAIVAFLLTLSDETAPGPVAPLARTRLKP